MLLGFGGRPDLGDLPLGLSFEVGLLADRGDRVAKVLARSVDLGLDLLRGALASGYLRAPCHRLASTPDRSRRVRVGHAVGRVFDVAADLRERCLQLGQADLEPGDGPFDALDSFVLGLDRRADPLEITRDRGRSASTTRIPPSSKPSRALTTRCKAKSLRADSLVA